MIAMSAVRMVEMSLDEKIDVIAVRNRRVAALRAMLMAGRVPGADVARGTIAGILFAHSDHMFVVMIVVMMMQVSVVEEVDMSVVN